MTDLLTLDGVEAGFGNRSILHGVDLAVPEGSAVGIFGLNGAGKSVTMKVVAGLVPVRAGQATFAGSAITRMQTEDRMRLGMAYVPQGRQLFPDLTVEQNLRLGSAVLRRRDAALATEAVARVYERFPRLAERRAQSAGSMSGGEQAMLAIGRALAGAPQLLLVDEPSAGLAPTVVESVFEMLQTLRSEGLTILLVEQNISLGFRLVDRAVILQTGRVVYDDVVSTLDTARVAELLGVGRLLGRGLEHTAARGEAAHQGRSKEQMTMSEDPTFKDVPVRGAELCTATWGAGPVVLGIHGITASSVSLAPVARIVAGDHTLVAPDLRGRGGSSAARGPWGMTAHAADCADLIETLADGPVVVLGHSMGAFVAVVLAATRPDLVERVVLVDGGLPIPIPMEIDVDAAMEMILGPSLARLQMTFESLAAYEDYWRVHPALTRDWNADIEAYLAYDLEGEPPALRSRVSDEAVRADGRDTLANVQLIVESAAALTCPVHLIRAPRNLMDEPTPLLPDVLVEHWQTVLPQLTAEVVDDVNHYTVVFNPRAAAVVADRVLHSPGA